MNTQHVDSDDERPDKPQPVVAPSRPPSRWNPMSGVNWRDPWGYPYLVLFAVTPVLTIACVLSVAGIFLLPFWYGYLSEFKPTPWSHKQTPGDELLIAAVYFVTVAITLVPVVWVVDAIS